MQQIKLAACQRTLNIRQRVAVCVAVGGKCPWLYHDGMWACKDQSACVGRWALCNGVRDCMDNSDEDGCQGR